MVSRKELEEFLVRERLRKLYGPKIPWGWIVFFIVLGVGLYLYYSEQYINIIDIINPFTEKIYVQVAIENVWYQYQPWLKGMVACSGSKDCFIFFESGKGGIGSYEYFLKVTLGGQEKGIVGNIPTLLSGTSVRVKEFVFGVDQPGTYQVCAMLYKNDRISLLDSICQSVTVS